MAKQVKSFRISDTTINQIETIKKNITTPVKVSGGSHE